MKNQTEHTRKYHAYDIIKMLDFLIDNIFVEFRGLIFQQIFSVPSVHNHWHICGWTWMKQISFRRFSKTKRKSTMQNSFTFRYIENILSLKTNTSANTCILYIRYISCLHISISQLIRYARAVHTIQTLHKGVCFLCRRRKD